MNRTDYHRKSKPMPTWNPFRTPSLLLATSGTPKLTSTRTGSSLYTRPTPAETEGFDILDNTLSSNGRAATTISPESLLTKGFMQHTLIHNVKPAGIEEKVCFDRPMWLAREVGDQANAC